MGPIEPAAITAATLLASKALEAVGGRLGEHAWAGMGRLAALVRDRFRGDRGAEVRLAELHQHPDDPDRVHEVARLLAGLAAQDDAFRQELTVLVDEARHDPTVGPLATRVYGQAQIGQLLNIGQARDIYIQPTAPAPSLVRRSSQAGGAPWPPRDRAISNLPPRNLVFTGRDDQLTDLRQRLHGAWTAAVVQPQALHGLGGVGKSQLALEYAYRLAEEYDVIWWLTAEQPAAIPGQLLVLARRLGIPEQTEQSETVAALLDELRRRDRWLLIFDNAEDPHDLRPYWPSGRGHVLVTSRNPSWSGLASTVQVDVLRRSEAVMFLQRRAGLEAAQAEALAEALGDLPLALEQAAAYLEETSTPAADYLDLLRDRGPELFALGRSVTSEQTIATTWTLSLDRIRAQTPAAQDLLALCAFLAPDDLPRSLLVEHPDRLPEPLATAVRDQVPFQLALGVLRRYSLATVTSEALSVHRLVQAVTRHALDADDAKLWAATAVRLVLAGFPGGAEDVRVWPVAARLLPHALAATDLARALDADPAATAALLYEGGRYLWGRAEHLQAKNLHERGLVIREAILGPDHALTGTSLNGLGNVLRDLGDYQAARRHLDRALAIREARLGPNDAHTANTLNNLAVVLRDLGDLATARDYHERALAIRERHFGDNKLRVAWGLNQLGHVLHDLGELDEARRHHLRALAIYESQLGPDHPDVARSLDHLGAVLANLDDLPAARAHHMRALAIREAQLGPDHPQTALSLYNLALVTHAQGDLDGARSLHERALVIRETRLGPDHPETALSLYHLAAVLRDEGDLDGAWEVHRRALAIREARLGADHPATLASRKALAAVPRT